MFQDTEMGILGLGVRRQAQQLRKRVNVLLAIDNDQALHAVLDVAGDQQGWI